MKHLFYLLPSTFCSASGASLLQYPQRRVPAWRSHDAAAGVCRRAAHVEPLHRRLVLRPAGRGAEEEELLQRQLSLEDVAFRQAEVPLDVEGRQDLAVQDDVLDVRRVLR